MALAADVSVEAAREIRKALRHPELRRRMLTSSPAHCAEVLSGGEWKPGNVHRLISYRAKRAVEEGRRLIVTIPPRHGKSELLSHWTPVWRLELDPAARILFATYQFDFGEEWGGKVRDTLSERRDLLDVKLKQHGGKAESTARPAAARWSTTERGGMWSAGVGGALTGRGGDLILIDDPHKNFEEAHSVTKRETVWNWYRSVARTRLHPGGAIIVIMTRWHEDDLTGMLLHAADEGDGEQFELLRLPAIAEEDERWEMPRGEVWERKAGEALWPEQWPADVLQDLKAAVGEYVWAALYQQRPAPAEGGLLKRGWWQEFRAMPNPLEMHDWLISWDSTFKDTDTGSYCVGQVWARQGPKKFLVDQIRERMDYPSFRAAVQNLAMRYPQARTILIEDAANGPAVIDDLQLRISGLTPVRATRSKESRVHAVSGDISSGNVFLPSPEISNFPVGEFIEECAAFPSGRNDDQVDAMSQALAHWNNAHSMSDVIEQYDARGGLKGRR